MCECVCKRLLESYSVRGGGGGTVKSTRGHFEGGGGRGAAKAAEGRLVGAPVKADNNVKDFVYGNNLSYIPMIWVRVFRINNSIGEFAKAVTW